MTTHQDSSRSRVRAPDAISTALAGLSTQRMRTFLAGLGIAIGVAAIVTVIGLGASSRANLLAELNRIGANLLTASPGPSYTGEAVALPSTSAAAASGITGVEVAASWTKVPGLTVRRTPYISEKDTSGVAVVASDIRLPAALGVTITTGSFLTTATNRAPCVVLGAVAARRLGSSPGQQLFMGGRWFTVVGVLSPALLDPAVDAMALIGRPAAEKFFGSADVADKVYVRTKQDESNAVRPLLAASVNPPNPATVAISRPSEALAAQTVAKDTFTGLFIGLGLVALLVGGVGIANVMVISVLERRGEIGLRRALGAKRSHIAVQFLIEAFALSTLGGILGSMIGLLAVVCTAVLRGWAPVVPVAAVAVSVMASVVVGIVAGAYPARRASQLSPTEALRS